MTYDSGPRAYQVKRGRESFFVNADTFREAMKKALPQLSLTDGYIWTVEEAESAESRRYRVTGDAASLIEINGERVNSADTVYAPNTDGEMRTATVQVMAQVEVPRTASVTDIQEMVQAEDLEILDGGVNIIELPHPEHEVFQE